MRLSDRHVQLLDQMVEAARMTGEEGFLHVGTMGGSWLISMGKPRTDIETSREVADQLVVEGLLGSRPNRRGDPIYFVTGAGYEQYDERHRPAPQRFAARFLTKDVLQVAVGLAAIGGFLVALWVALRQ